MNEGLFESLVTSELQSQLAATDLVPSTSCVDDAEAPHVLARHVAQALVRRLSVVKDAAQQVALANEVLRLVDDPGGLVVGGARGPEQLLSLAAVPGPGVRARSTERPATPLSDVALMTNASTDPTLMHELRAELPSADGVDLLCAFVRWSGLRLLEAQLNEMRERGVPLRVITTTYVGSTERHALDRLVRDFGAQVRVQYDVNRTRLHAKAWLFRRNTGFDTAYVGSSNLTNVALLEGVEWNVRLSRIASPTLLQKFEATFDIYWNDETYELYDPDRDADRLDEALRRASGRSDPGTTVISISGLEVRARPHQQRILDELEAERQVHGRHRNLVVAATGTGKTVVAALDYRRLAAAADDRPSLLFVAHRKEILQQSLRTYREVLSDANFGELYVDGARPEKWRHVFASVQSLHSYGVNNIPVDAYDIVVVDEFHHAEARTYRDLLDRLAPHELLGLTATPERADGADVRAFFDGRSASELRLWEALNDELLAPFHYFGVADNTDLERLEWKRGRYDEAALSALFTGNDARARIVLNQLRDKVPDVRAMRALGYCVSVEHAHYMAAVFTQAGIAAAAVSGQTSSTERANALQQLRDRKINVLFAVDLFNEGLDLPEVDTVLFLRPTESATIFLQQLGRGLRHADGKSVLTVLDFVGHNRQEFRFDLRYRALTGATRSGLAHQVEAGFPFLPSGCQIVLDQQTQTEVLANIRNQLISKKSFLVSELRHQSTPRLRDYLEDTGAELTDVVRPDRSWTSLGRAAGLALPDAGPREDALIKRMRAFAHVDDPDRAAAYRRLLSRRDWSYASLSAAEQALADMLIFSLWPDGGGFASFEESFAALFAEPAICDELEQVVDLAFDAASHVTGSLGGRLRWTPLRTHARYTREEALAALGVAKLDGRKPGHFREGVLWMDHLQTDAFFVTLKKSDTDYSPTTMYRDYAISPALFHWETQSGTSEASPTGQRYIRESGRSTQALIFCRAAKTSEFGTGAPYTLLGTARYVSHRGERPIAITWALDTPMTADMFAETSVVAR